MAKLIAKPVDSLFASFEVPGDKSVSQRALILGAIANGVSKISGLLLSDDVLSTLNVLQKMGVKIKHNTDYVSIYGVGIWGFKKPLQPLYFGNSGTATRLMLGILAAQKFSCELSGDRSLSRRPMARIIKPLTEMGAVIISSNNTLPLKVEGGQNLKAISYQLKVASAQVKSCLLLAGLYAKGKTSIIEPVSVRDHTERMLKCFAYKLDAAKGKICLQGGGELTATNIQIAGDISSATFFIVAATIANKASINIIGVGVNPTRIGVISILRLMGADIVLTNKRKLSAEPVADIVIKSAKLKGINIPKELVPFAIDEFPAIFIAASCAKGETILTGARELRVKESDRIQVMADGLEAMGIYNQVLADGIKIQGGVFKKPNAIIKSCGDHRVAMAFAVASLKCNHDITIDDVDNIKTSFPNFVKLANFIGMDIVNIK